VRLVDHYDDGQDARHFTFEPLALGLPAPAFPGQFFMLTVPGHCEAPFTYVRPPDALGRFDALVRRVGDLTTALFEVPIGSVLGARGPLGRGWPMHLLRGKRVLVIAGGCGLAPLASAIESLVEEQSARIAVIYGSRSEAMQVLGRERERWQTRLPMLTTYDHPTRPEHVKGLPLALISQAADALGGEPDCALVCGPDIMMLATGAALAARGLAAERIFLSLERRMHCGVGLCGHCHLAQTYVCKDGPTYAYDALLSLLAKSPKRAATLTEIRHC
jgi:NAD(P)H-flavin reductase